MTMAKGVKKVVWNSIYASFAVLRKSEKPNTIVVGIILQVTYTLLEVYIWYIPRSCKASNRWIVLLRIPCHTWNHQFFAPLKRKDIEPHKIFVSLSAMRMSVRLRTLYGGNTVDSRPYSSWPDNPSTQENSKAMSDCSLFLQTYLLLTVSQKMHQVSPLCNFLHGLSFPLLPLGAPWLQNDIINLINSGIVKSSCSISNKYPYSFKCWHWHVLE